MTDITQYLAQAPILEPIVANLGISVILIIVALAIIKGLALFKAARLNEKVWFWIMLVTSTVGILPLIYLYLRRDKKA